MNKIKFNFFRINFNSYFPYAYEIQKGNYIHYLPKTKNNNITDNSKLLIREKNPNIIIGINDLKKIDNNNLISTKNSKQKVKTL